MSDWLKRNSHHMLRLLQVIFIMFISLLLTVIVSFALAGVIYHRSMAEILQVAGNFNGTTDVNILKFLQVFQSIGLFIIPPVMIAISFRENIPSWLRLNRLPSAASVILAVLIILTSIPFINYLSSLNAEMRLPVSLKGIETWMKSTEDSAQKLTEAFLSVNSWSGLLFNLFMMALLPAIGEELLFRGVIQRVLIEWSRNIHWGIVLTAIIFSAFHLQFYGFLPRMALGIMLGYFFAWSGSIWLSIAAHFTNNAMAVIYYFLYSQNKVHKDIDQIGSSSDTYMYTVVSVIIMLALFYALYQKRSALEETGHSDSER